MIRQAPVTFLSRNLYDSSHDVSRGAGYRTPNYECNHSAENGAQTDAIPAIAGPEVVSRINPELFRERKALGICHRSAAFCDNHGDLSLANLRRCRCAERISPARADLEWSRDAFRFRLNETNGTDAPATCSPESVRGYPQRIMDLALSHRPSWFAQTFFAGAPGACLPERFQRTSAAMENIAFCLADVGYALRITRTRQTAFAITGVLPKMPVTPWRGGLRPSTVVRHPQPAIRQYRFIYQFYLWAV